MTEKIEANYSELERIQGVFSENADTLENWVAEVKRRVDALRSTWSGRGSEAFIKEMDQEVFPTFKKLVDALVNAARTTDTITKSIGQAETEASVLFSKE